MRPLPTTYTKNGFNHEVIYREDQYVISKLTSNESSRVICYEVFKVKKNKRVVFGERVIEGWESTPPNEDWGTTGFSVHTLDEAHKKIELLKQKECQNKLKNGKKVMNLL